ncbi:hypothetical protein TIFTF001_000197 [Ficus carica]|uniref:Uncharacterized protein n=1 Tax=Ficus carica TaxID=3494 RepID=A0AA87ZFA9_FICCA|nr:hypothetical protein TIFTF001_000197 [Ficus carica]
MSETTAFCENIAAGGGADVRRRRWRRRGGVRGEGRVEGGSVKKKRPRVLVLVRGWRRERERSGLGLGEKEEKSKWWIGMLKRRWSKTVEEVAEAEEPIGAMPVLGMGRWAAGGRGAEGREERERGRERGGGRGPAREVLGGCRRPGSRAAGVGAVAGADGKVTGAGEDLGWEESYERGEGPGGGEEEGGETAALGGGEGGEKAAFVGGGGTGGRGGEGGGTASFVEGRRRRRKEANRKTTAADLGTPAGFGFGLPDDVMEMDPEIED